MRSNLCVQLDLYRVNAQRYPVLIRERRARYEWLIEETDFEQVGNRLLADKLRRNDVKALAYCFAKYDEMLYGSSSEGVPPMYMMMLGSIASKAGISEKKAKNLITDITYKTAGECFSSELQKLLDKHRINASNLEDLLGIGRSTFSKIANSTMRPTRGLAMAVAIFFKLNSFEADDFMMNCGFPIRECFPDLYFEHFIENGMAGTRDFVSGVIVESMRENANREAHNRNVAKSKRVPLLELDPFFSARSKTGLHAYRNLSIDDCKDEQGTVTRQKIRDAIESGPDLFEE